MPWKFRVGPQLFARDHLERLGIGDRDHGARRARELVCRSVEEDMVDVLADARRKESARHERATQDQAIRVGRSLDTPEPPAERQESQPLSTSRFESITVYSRMRLRTSSRSSARIARSSSNLFSAVARPARTRSVTKRSPESFRAFRDKCAPSGAT